MATSPPVVPDGTRLHLRPGQWTSTSPDLANARHLDVIVTRVHPMVVDGCVGVSAHRLECDWPSVEEHPPCVDLRVTVRALVEAVGP